jgi:hypothetical protein
VAELQLQNILRAVRHRLIGVSLGGGLAWGSWRPCCCWSAARGSTWRWNCRRPSA